MRKTVMGWLWLAVWASAVVLQWQRSVTVIRHPVTNIDEPSPLRTELPALSINDNMSYDFA